MMLGIVFTIVDENKILRFIKDNEKVDRMYFVNEVIEDKALKMVMGSLRQPYVILRYPISQLDKSKVFINSFKLVKR